MLVNTLPAREGKGFSTKNGSIVHVQDNDASLPAIMMGMCMTAQSKKFVRAVGGVAGLTLEMRAKIGPYFVDGFTRESKTFKGVISSGGTIEFRHKDGHDYLDDSVVQVATAVGVKYGAVVVHTTPQTGLLQQHRRSGQLVVGGDIDKNWNGFDYRSDFQLIVRPDGDKLASAWDLDTPHYRKLMVDLVKNGWVAGGTMANGGLVSLYESIELIALGMPVILVEGTGRECDALVKAARTGCFADVALETWQKLTKANKPLDSYQAAIKRTKEVLGGLEKTDKLIAIANIADAKTHAAAADKFGFLD